MKYAFLNDLKFLTDTRCLKIKEKVSINIASKASYIYILSGQKLIKNVKNGPFFENLKLAVKQKNGKIGKCQNSNATFWVIFKQCADTLVSCIIQRWQHNFSDIKAWTWIILAEKIQLNSTIALHIPCNTTYWLEYLKTLVHVLVELDCYLYSRLRLYARTLFITSFETNL